MTPKSPAGPSKRVMGIVFADVVGFGSLTESEVHAFASTLLPECTGLATNHNTAYCNTWGDAIVAYFDSLEDSLDYALELRDLFRNRNWGAHHDPYRTPLSVRIGMHAADVFVAKNDAVPGGAIFGTQVSLAARIEPVTTPNEVFATEAAMASVQRSNVVTTSLGKVALPKEGRHEKLLWVRRKGEISRRESIRMAPPALRTVDTTEEAMGEIASSKAIRSLKILTLNGGSSMHSLLGVAERRLAKKARVSIVVFDPEFQRLPPPIPVPAFQENDYLKQLRDTAMAAPASGRAACEYLMQASQLTAWSTESQDAQTDRLGERLMLCLREVTASGVHAVLVKSPRWVPARCWLVDDRAYITSHWQPNSLAPIIVAEKRHPLYDAAHRHFEYVWNEALNTAEAVLLDAESAGKARQ
jgi:class 3 adenylate cyclase